MTSANPVSNGVTARPQSDASTRTPNAGQTEGQALYQQSCQSQQPEVLVKRQFEQRTRDQQAQLANEFIASAGWEGINKLAATPSGQHALAVVYDHAAGQGRELMREVHEEQGNTAVDYTRDESGTRSPEQQLFTLMGEVNTFNGGAGAGLFNASEQVIDKIEKYDGYLKEYDDLNNHKAAPATLARKEKELVRAFEELSDTLKHKKLPLFERYSFGTTEGVNLNGRRVRESIPVSSCDDAQRLLKYAKFGKIAGPAFVALDGFFRTKSVIDKYHANDPTWKREAVVQSAGFAGGLILGGMAALGADHAITHTVEKIYSYFD
ncbi:MAG: hypothetical protein ABW095_10235 [Candidatus Thiodiazotropha sp.]